jgi:hypothetical protein
MAAIAPQALALVLGFFGTREEELAALAPMALT